MTVTTSDRSALLAANDATTRLFLRQDARRIASEYLASRGITHLPPRWQVGYARPEWNSLTRELLSEGFRPQTLVDAGLSFVSRRGALVDVFRDRVMFPIRSADGDVLGFTGRDISSHVAGPKYLNTRRTVLFDKSAVLYGLWESSDLRTSRVPVVVEGPLDALAVASRDRDSHQFMPVALCGSALTIRHAEHLSMISTAVVIAMDGDTAGHQAAIRAGETLRHQGLTPRIALTPTDTDPCSYLADPVNALDAFEPANGLSLLKAQVQVAVARQGDRMQWVEGRLGAAREMTGYLRTYTSIEASDGIPWVASAVGVAASTLTELVSASRHTARRPPPPHEPREAWHLMPETTTVSARRLAALGRSPLEVP